MSHHDCPCNYPLVFVISKSENIPLAAFSRLKRITTIFITSPSISTKFTLHYISLGFNNPEKKTASNLHFLLFPTIVSDNPGQILSFHSHLLCCLQMLSIWKGRKILSFGKEEKSFRANCNHVNKEPMNFIQQGMSQIGRFLGYCFKIQT